MMAAPSTFLRKLNERRLLNEVRLAGQVSRADLERRLKLAMPTVSRIVDRLLMEGWLREVGFAESAGGRPPMLVEVNPNGIGSIGIELGRNAVRLVYANLLGEARIQRELPSFRFQTPEQFVSHVESFVRQEQLRGEPIIGIGVAAPGQLDADVKPQYITLDGELHWTDVPLVEMLENRLDVPVYLANDANAAALGETWFGLGRNVRHVAFILADAGIGAGLAIDGSIYGGAANLAGEFSHSIVDLYGELCEDGHRGCVNIAAAQPAIVRAIRKVRPVRDDEPIEHIVARARAGHSPDLEVVSRALDFLAAGVANIVRIFDPHVVILGGQTMLTDTFMISQMEERITKFCSPERRIPVLPTSYGVWAVAIGAATVVLQRIYDHTQLVDTAY
ncbi:MAG: ROK family transcriptional regulator [Alicyclobacillus sp.]|nr:ROK family transcriptional regulator [Alicyclobacillus sp.]